MTKFCRDCKYQSSRPGGSTPVCSNRGSVRIMYLVDGDDEVDKRRDCYDMRRDGACGYEGKLWEPRG